MVWQLPVNGFIKEHVYNACSDWSKPVFGSGHPNTEDYHVVVIL